MRKETEDGSNLKEMTDTVIPTMTTVWPDRFLCLVLWPWEKVGWKQSVGDLTD